MKETVLFKRADENELISAANILREGGLVIFPTETVYGLGANAYDEKAAYNVFEAKGRPHDNPLIVHVADPADAETFAVTTKLYYRLARAFMPGPLTLIIEKKHNIPDEVTAGGGTVGVRCPSHPTAHRFIELCGVPVAAPSANLSGRPSPTRFDHCVADMNGRVDAIIDGGECEVGLESTVALLKGDDEVVILRPGAVTAEALSCVCSRVSSAFELKEGERPLSPGMKYKHYAPRAPLYLLDGERRDVIAFVRGKMKDERCLFLCFDEDAETFSDCRDRTISLGGEDDEALHAHRLFAALRETDVYGETHTLDAIYTYSPKKDGTGLSPAIENRLLRAANHTIIKVK